MESPLVVLSQVARVLEQQEITYVLVGSLASSMHGMYRSTANIDLLADIKPDQVRPLRYHSGKLRWYREGNEVSSTQWSDVLGMLGAQSVNLDVDYLRDWADKLGVRDLLEKAFSSVEGKFFDLGNHKNFLPSAGSY